MHVRTFGRLIDRLSANIFYAWAASRRGLSCTHSLACARSLTVRPRSWRLVSDAFATISQQRPVAAGAALREGTRRPPAGRHVKRAEGGSGPPGSWAEGCKAASLGAAPGRDRPSTSPALGPPQAARGGTRAPSPGVRGAGHGPGLPRPHVSPGPCLNCSEGAPLQRAPELATGRASQGGGGGGGR